MILSEERGFGLISMTSKPSNRPSYRSMFAKLMSFAPTFSTETFTSNSSPNSTVSGCSTEIWKLGGSLYINQYPAAPIPNQTSDVMTMVTSAVNKISLLRYEVGVGGYMSNSFGFYEIPAILKS
jgi:hypothetical protein